MLKNHIVVETVTQFIEQQSNPQENRYVFAYTITITNRGEIGAKLLTRHWLITDANNKIQEVHGDGVVGEQPYLKAGQRYTYTSGAVVETSVAIMQGHYTMFSDEGQSFNAPIPRFTLSIPRTLH